MGAEMIVCDLLTNELQYKVTGVTMQDARCDLLHKIGITSYCS